MSTTMIDHAVAAAGAADFATTRPFPWTRYEGFLTAPAFEQLRAEWPATELFQRHENLAREHGQRPHDRYYLSLEESDYGVLPGAPGCARLRDLPACWQGFVAELRGARYADLISRLLDTDAFHLRFAWHMATAGNEVSPHCDSTRRYGTQLFYFNDDDWQEEWGGQTWLLADRQTERLDPGIDDFGERVAAPLGSNVSVLFKNGNDHWHGVAPLECPPDRMRRLFLVDVHLREPAWKRAARRLRDRAARLT